MAYQNKLTAQGLQKYLDVLLKLEVREGSTINSDDCIWIRKNQTVPDLQDKIMIKQEECMSLIRNMPCPGISGMRLYHRLVQHDLSRFRIPWDEEDGPLPLAGMDAFDVVAMLIQVYSRRILPRMQSKVCARFTDRDVEIVRLRDQEGRTFGEIPRLLLQKNPAWCRKDGRPLSRDAVEMAYHRAKGKCR